ncbi:MAG: hypothetical protein JWQ38_3294 [Flavipsychrobacter sp.]|nr:hypothetical protein [Flavipsychrobacter sp.]
MAHYEPPIKWNDHEDIAMKLYERFGKDFGESKIYRIRFTELLDWILEIPNFEGTREGSTEGHLEMIQSAWVYEWRDNQ